MTTDAGTPDAVTPDAVTPDAGTPDRSTPEGWEETTTSLRRVFVFADFSEAWGFMNRVALAAEKQDHHPDWSNSWNTVTIELSSHDAGGKVTGRDRRLARRINELVAAV